MLAASTAASMRLFILLASEPSNRCAARLCSPPCLDPINGLEFERKKVSTFENSNGGRIMTRKGRAAELAEAVGSNHENIEHLVDEMDGFFASFNAEIEGWKFVMEEFEDGTRILARFQIRLKR
jgi:hypothetical protein